MALTADDIPEAVTWLTESLELAREGADDREIGAAARSLAAAMVELGETGAGDGAPRRESRRSRESIGETHGIAVCLETFAGLAASRSESRTRRDALRRERRGARVDRRAAAARQPDPLRPLARANARRPRHEHVLEALRGWASTLTRRGVFAGPRQQGAGLEDRLTLALLVATPRSTSFDSVRDMTVVVVLLIIILALLLAGSLIGLASRSSGSRSPA